MVPFDVCVFLFVYLPSVIRLGGNIAIDVAAIVISALQVKRDNDAQDGRLARMEIGAKLAGLKVRLQVRRIPMP